MEVLPEKHWIIYNTLPRRFRPEDMQTHLPAGAANALYIRSLPPGGRDDPQVRGARKVFFTPEAGQTLQFRVNNMLDKPKVLW